MSLPLLVYGRRSLTRLEAALYIVIAAILITIVAERLLDYMETAERSAVQATLTNLTAAINTRLAYAIIRGEASNLTDWTRRNPFDLAHASAGNYAGEIDTSEAGSMERGAWAFDAVRGELVYRPRLRRGLETSDPMGALRFRAAIDPRGLGYRLEADPPYRWN